MVVFTVTFPHTLLPPSPFPPSAPSYSIAFCPLYRCTLADSTFHFVAPLPLPCEGRVLEGQTAPKATGGKVLKGEGLKVCARVRVLVFDQCVILSAFCVSCSHVFALFVCLLCSPANTSIGACCQQLNTATLFQRFRQECALSAFACERNSGSVFCECALAQV